MKLTDLSPLRDAIMELARRSSFAERVQGVSIEPGEDGYGGEFLRVQFEIKDPDSLRLEDVEPLMRSIEDAVAEKDERFPSVRFAEAA